MAWTYSLAAFQEPRGMMRVLQFIFAICAFATTTNFSVDVTSVCTVVPATTPPSATVVRHLDYPFRFEYEVCKAPTAANNAVTTPIALSADVGSDAEFFVATGVLSMLYCIFIVLVYAYLNDAYRNKSELPLADFMITTVLAIFWLSGSAAWSNGTAALKTASDAKRLQQLCATVCASITTGGFTKLNMSLLLGYLNFFLWAADLWFLYKETIWFHGRQPAMSTTGGGGVTTSAGAASPSV